MVEGLVEEAGGQPKAAVAFVSMLRRKKPSRGDRSSPPIEGTMPLKTFRNGSDTANTGCSSEIPCA